MKFFKALMALLFTAALLAGCNKTEEADPAMDAAPAATDSAAPADEAAPAAEPAPAEPAQEEPGGWVPPPEGS